MSPNESVVDIDLSTDPGSNYKNKIGHEGVRAMAKYLKENRVIGVLSLRNAYVG